MKHILSTIIFISLLLVIFNTSSANDQINNNDQTTNKEANNQQININQLQSISKPTNCPNGMVEVEGDFCPNLEEECINVDKSIHNVNGYPRCLEFKYPTKCLSKQTKHLHFCIDKYEYPNIEGQKPQVMLSYYDMQKNCAAENKRMCWDYEWTLACEGKERSPYPYGYQRDPTACNIDHPQRPGFDASTAKLTPVIVEWLNQSVPSGSMKKCVSSYGVSDMSGNVDEIVMNSNHGQPLDPAHLEGKKQYWSSEKGGAWLWGHRNLCRPATTVHSEDSTFFEFGSRCCSNIQNQ